MKFITVAISAFLFILGGCGTGGSLGPREGQVEPAPGYEVSKIEEVKSLGTFRGVEFTPLVNTLGYRLSSDTVDYLNSEIFRELEEEGLIVSSERRAAVSGKVTGLSRGWRGSAIVIEIAVQDAHNWNQLATFEIENRPVKDRREAASILARAVRDLLKTRIAPP